MKDRVFFIPNRLFWLVLLIGVLLMSTGLVMAQDSPPVEVPTSPGTIEVVLASVIAYLLYVLTLSASVQTAINSLKPLFLDPIKASVDTNQYLIVMYVFRTLVSGAGYLWLWGGVPATRAVVPILPVIVPDLGIGVVTVALVVLGEEVIHPVLDRLYALRDAAKLLAVISPPTPQLE